MARDKCGIWNVPIIVAVIVGGLGSISTGEGQGRGKGYEPAVSEPSDIGNSADTGGEVTGTIEVAGNGGDGGVPASSPGEKPTTQPGTSPSQRPFIINRVPQTKELKPMGELVSDLKSENMEARREGAQGLGNYGVSAKTWLPALLPLLRDSNPTVRCAAADAIGKIGCDGRETVIALGKATEDTEPEIRLAAARSLARIGRQSLDVLPSLVHLLQDTSYSIRATGAFAIGSIGPEAKAALPDLFAILQKEGSESDVSGCVAFAVGQIGGMSEEQERLLANVLKDSKNRSVVVYAAMALAKQGRREETVRTLISAIGSKDRKENAIFGLGAIGPECVKELVGALRQPHDPEARRGVVMALGCAGPQDKMAVEAVKESLHDPDSTVRDTARETLLLMGIHGSQ